MGFQDAWGFYKGMDTLEKNLDLVAEGLGFSMIAANKEAALLMQQEVVSRVPVHTGETRDAFASPDAVGPAVDPNTRFSQYGYVFGLRTAALRAKGYKAIWIEFGTKGYARGEKRYYLRKDKNGRFVRRYTKIRRNVPPRPAHPFFRPGIAAAVRELTNHWEGAISKALGRPLHMARDVLSSSISEA
jgi:hypothetical protein